jgi:putative redox protein
MKMNAVWQGKMKFESTNEAGLSVAMDVRKAAGGEESAQSPKQLVLSGLAGCTGMDVISILGKMRALPETFRIEVEAELTEEHPRTFKKVHLKYIVKGDVPEDKLKRAIELSQDRYCGVSEMMRKSAALTYEYVYED